MHKQILDKEEQKLIEELQDIEELKAEGRFEEYNEAERHLDEQDKVIMKQSDIIRRIRNR